MATTNKRSDGEDRLFQQERQRADVVEANNCRHEIALLAPPDSIGAEFGVDTGQLSRRFLDLDYFSEFHSVDKWDDHAHSERQYWAVAEKLMPYPKSRVWRMTAQQFSKLVPDEFFGFIYIDCYAHTGQDDGDVLRHLWPKLQKGGLFSGDDYDRKHFRKTYDAVNRFAEQQSRRINVWNKHLDPPPKLRTDGHPSWWFYK